MKVILLSIVYFFIFSIFMSCKSAQKISSNSIPKNLILGEKKGKITDSKFLIKQVHDRIVFKLQIEKDCVDHTKAADFVQEAIYSWVKLLSKGIEDNNALVKLKLGAPLITKQAIISWKSLTQHSGLASVDSENSPDLIVKFFCEPGRSFAQVGSNWGTPTILAKLGYLRSSEDLTPKDTSHYTDYAYNEKMLRHVAGYERDPITLGCVETIAFKELCEKDFRGGIPEDRDLF